MNSLKIFEADQTKRSEKFAHNFHCLIMLLEFFIGRRGMANEALKFSTPSFITPLLVGVYRPYHDQTVPFG